MESEAFNRDAEKSALWSDLAGKLREKYREILGADADELLKNIGSVDPALHYGFYYDKSEKSLNEKIGLASKAQKEAAAKIKNIASECGDKIEDTGSYVFLEAAGLFDEYLRLIQSLSIAPDMSSARHFYYARRLRGFLAQAGIRSARVLEIGAGAGNLSLLLRHYGLVRDYTIIDLPEMLLMSGVSLEQHSGGECCFLEFPPAVVSKPANYLLAADQNMAGLPDGAFDLVLNFNSFSEMPPAVVSRYFDIIYRTARRGALFMNVNRIKEYKQPDGIIFDMNPLLFPYRTTDKILELDVDPFQQFVRQFCRSKPVRSTAITRASIV